MRNKIFEQAGGVQRVIYTQSCRSFAENCDSTVISIQTLNVRVKQRDDKHFAIFDSLKHSIKVRPIEMWQKVGMAFDLLSVHGAIQRNAEQSVEYENTFAA